MTCASGYQPIPLASMFTVENLSLIVELYLSAPVEVWWKTSCLAGLRLPALPTVTSNRCNSRAIILASLLQFLLYRTKPTNGRDVALRTAGAHGQGAPNAGWCDQRCIHSYDRVFVVGFEILNDSFIVPRLLIAALIGPCAYTFDLNDLAVLDRG